MSTVASMSGKSQGGHRPRSAPPMIQRWTIRGLRAGEFRPLARMWRPGFDIPALQAAIRERMA